MNKQLSIVFAGTPDISASILSDLIESEQFNIIGVYTQPDRPKGRGRSISQSPVKQIAQNASLNVFQPTSFKKEPHAIDQLKELNPDLMIVIAYGLILPKPVLDIPKYGCINIHVSLLPKWRGAAPIQRAIEHGDKQTGITIMQMDEGLDTGDILNTKVINIEKNETAQSLHDKLAIMATPLLLDTIQKIQNKTISPQTQNEKNASYAEKISKSEGLVNWSLSAIEIERKMRAFFPWPGSYTFINNQMVKLADTSFVEETHQHPPGLIISISNLGMKIATGDGILLINQLQFPGKKMMDIKTLINGRALDGLVNTVIGEKHD
ncbi:methionyl-tRNA formyltransferase [Thiotrichales bacterium 19S11-10]|nr:methionyl-tRNA formyltransferase [Thiotrichales bacterium 19S11-10]